MSLNFPNPSRSFDETRNAVRFTGHDGMFEVRFLVETGALAEASKGAAGAGEPEAKFLSAFDSSRTSIHNVARKVYSRTQRSSYILTAEDFR